jgi:hypothetical protein
MIPTLAELLDEYENGTLNLEESAHKYYLTEQHKAFDNVSWIHNHELAVQSTLRKIAKSAERDLLRNPKTNVNN